MELKECKKCGRELPSNTDYYFKKKDTKDGFTNDCKECRGKKFTNKLTKIPKEGYKFCIRCDRELKATNSYFPNDNLCKDGLRNVCRECGKDGHFMEENYTPKRWWIDEENELFIERYPNYTNEELIEIHYPNETYKNIVERAFRLHVTKSEETTNRINKIKSEKTSGENSWNYGVKRSEETKMKLSKAKKGKFVGKDNWWTGKKRSEDQRRHISARFKKSGYWKGETNPRHINPLKGETNGNWHGGISELYDHLRRNISEWKKGSMETSNYKCVVTGQKFDDIHHLYGFDSIIEDTLMNVNLPIKAMISEYTLEELKIIEEECLRIHMENIGVCLKRDIHIIFHKTYGYGNNTQEQFEEFKVRYINGEFNNLLDEVV